MLTIGTENSRCAWAIKLSTAYMPEDAARLSSPTAWEQCLGILRVTTLIRDLEERHSCTIKSRGQTWRELERSEEASDQMRI